MFDHHGDRQKEAQGFTVSAPWRETHRQRVDVSAWRTETEEGEG